MRKLWRFSPLILALGCSSSDIQDAPDPPKVVEEISEYDYDYYSGHNAAVFQFGSQYSDLVVDLSNKEVTIYTNNNDHTGYADGYHRALDIIYSRDNPQCPDIH